jgi:hypothetical protein
MDPNATLAGIRALTDKFMEGVEEFTEADTTELVVLVNTLDDWLSRGGYRPAGWLTPPLPSDEEGQ